LPARPVPCSVPCSQSLLLPLNSGDEFDNLCAEVHGANAVVDSDVFVGLLEQEHCGWKKSRTALALAQGVDLPHLG
ncbi:hypothetical protein LZM23_29415, partial [Pseudomonas aeruginosa]|nr:hypothetical protein [Pseudomonas aeruginosa]